MGHRQSKVAFCTFCRRRVARSAAFCGLCGAKQPKQAVRDPLGGKPWQEFHPALTLWCLWLGVNGLLGLLLAAKEERVLEAESVGQAFAVVVTVAFFLADRERLGRLLRPMRRPLMDLGRTIVVMAALWLFMWLYFAGLGWMNIPTESYLDAYRDAGWPLWIAFVEISVVPGIAEELAFRGFIYGRLRRALSRTDALLLQAAMFSILHMSPLIFASHFVMGLGFGYLRIKTGRLWCPILAHMGWNAYVLLTELQA